MRLIDADALIRSVDGNRFITDSIKDYVKLSVNAQPTIEPERKTGEWIDDYSTGGYYANCSECRCQIDVHENRGYPNFCPDCGADMRR